MSRPVRDPMQQMVELVYGVMTMRDLTNRCLEPACDACTAATDDLELPAVESLPGSRDRRDAVALNLTLAVRFRDVAFADGSENCPAGRYALAALSRKRESTK